ncbi:hypothetical protein B0G62_10466 [Paraburkholderia eburnea]|uniref:Uncharacterized protein n=1 Tax=Paraburkholderia eburnea TaxID=1189126 RepID=A0A2S4MDR2_9BURK|nr:hypothetical protein [Paraburkholderia eburnea]POR52769.1 hypothetical protein B0G62_10466 [Paraburkholderia eburnea]PRZ23637.1 hypothetical protein BX588_10466 [Paraburkholderia eburnea]
MAGVVQISVKSNVDRIERSLDTFVRQQIPFATATALNALARQVQRAEVDNMRTTFRNPSPFTLRSVRMTAARKTNLEATVFVMDRAAGYLIPYEDGGVHKLPGPALFNPKDIDLNQYGQLGRGIMAKLRGRKDIFIGKVQTSHGPINGVWQRLEISRSGGVRRKRAGQGSLYDKDLGALKLLIRFGDALPVRQHLNFELRAYQIVNMGFRREFGRALGKAIASAR